MFCAIAIVIDAYLCKVADVLSGGLRLEAWLLVWKSDVGIVSPLYFGRTITRHVSLMLHVGGLFRMWQFKEAQPVMIFDLLFYSRVGLQK